jgi:cell division transport system permease protein
MSSNTSPRGKAHGFSALSTSFGVALTLGLLGALVAMALIIRDLRSDWMSAVSVEVVLERGWDGDVQKMEAEWTALSQVTQAQFFSADSASAELERELGEPFMDFLGAAPLPAVLELKLDADWLSSTGVAGLSELALGWESLPDVVRVDFPKRVLERLESGFSNWTLPLSVVVFLLVALVVAQILNVVRLSVFGRRYLIRSMELVGAPPNRIRRPFIGEAMGYGAVGAFLAYAILVALLAWLKPFLSVLSSWGMSELALVLGAQLLMGLLITGLSARWAVGRYLGASLDKLL